MSAKDLVDNHTRIYDEVYDDQDRYGDLMHQMYDALDGFVKEQCLTIFDRHNIQDFQKFFMANIQRHQVDTQNKALIKTQVTDDWKGVPDIGLPLSGTDQEADDYDPDEVDDPTLIDE